MLRKLLITHTLFVSVCSAQYAQESCQSTEIACDRAQLSFWLTLINNDHIDGVQAIRAPKVTLIDNLCSGNPVAKIQDSEDCAAIVPQWVSEPEIEYLKGRRGYRYVKMNWSNSNLEGAACLDHFEVKYWPRGKASRSFVTSAIQAEVDQNKVYSDLLEVEECEEYTYVIRANKIHPTFVANHRGSFESKCKTKSPVDSVTKSTGNSVKTSTEAPVTSTTSEATTTTTTTTSTTTTTPGLYKLKCQRKIISFCCNFFHILLQFCHILLHIVTFCCNFVTFCCNFVKIWTHFFLQFCYILLQFCQDCEL